MPISGTGPVTLLQVAVSARGSSNALNDVRATRADGTGGKPSQVVPIRDVKIRLLVSVDQQVGMVVVAITVEGIGKNHDTSGAEIFVVQTESRLSVGWNRR